MQGTDYRQELIIRLNAVSQEQAFYIGRLERRRVHMTLEEAKIVIDKNERAVTINVAGSERIRATKHTLWWDRENGAYAWAIQYPGSPEHDRMKYYLKWEYLLEVLWNRIKYSAQFEIGPVIPATDV
jgi:hypothetical protein